jgi:hypothetical protein
VCKAYTITSIFRFITSTSDPTPPTGLRSSWEVLGCRAINLILTGVSLKSNSLSIGYDMKKEGENWQKRIKAAN